VPQASSRSFPAREFRHLKIQAFQYTIVTPEGTLQLFALVCWSQRFLPFPPCLAIQRSRQKRHSKRHGRNVHLSYPRESVDNPRDNLSFRCARILDNSACHAGWFRVVLGSGERRTPIECTYLDASPL